MAECTTRRRGAARACAEAGALAGCGCAAITGIPAEQDRALAKDYAPRLQRTGRPAVIRLNYGVQRSENGGTAVRAVCDASADHRKLAAPRRWAAALDQRIVSVQLGGAADAGADAGEPAGACGARGEYEPAGRGVDGAWHGGARGGGASGEGAVRATTRTRRRWRPNQNAVLRGMCGATICSPWCTSSSLPTRRTTRMWCCPRRRFSRQRMCRVPMGICTRRCRSRRSRRWARRGATCGCSASWRGAWGSRSRAFRDTEDELIDQALATNDPWFAGITRERLEREGHVALALPRIRRARAAVFDRAGGFARASGCGELMPVPVFVAPDGVARRRGGRRAASIRWSSCRARRTTI